MVVVGKSGPHYALFLRGCSSRNSKEVLALVGAVVVLVSRPNRMSNGCST